MVFLVVQFFHLWHEYAQILYCRQMMKFDHFGSVNHLTVDPLLYLQHA
jgi:hypothetical protein